MTSIILFTHTHTHTHTHTLRFNVLTVQHILLGHAYKLSMSSLTESHQVFFGRRPTLCLIPSTSRVIQRLIHHVFVQRVKPVSTYSSRSSNWHMVPILRVLWVFIFFLWFSLTPFISLFYIWHQTTIFGNVCAATADVSNGQVQRSRKLPLANGTNVH